MIRDMLPQGQASLFSGVDANRELAFGTTLNGYRIIHFGTHGMMDPEHPETSGIILSFVDRNGQAQDGVLRVAEIYDLRLVADLVVLSACQMALGKNVKGEGLIGLTRGFMYAGTPRVVASLWRVDDESPAELMQIFYRGIVKEGKRPAAAFRAAQIEMLGNKRWHAPHYWAAFVFQGEWK